MARPPRTVPTFDRLMWPALIALKAMGGSASNEELLAKIIELEHIPEDVAAVIHNDQRQTKLNYNLAWAKTYLKRVGALDNSTRGVWSITAAGERLSEKDVDAVPSTVRRQDYDRKRLGNGDDVSEEVSGDESAAELQSWKDVLVDAQRKMDPSAFERLAQRILREAGFIKLEVTGRSGDGGIEGIGVLRVNLLSFQVLFQCKRYQGSVTAGEVRNFRGAMIGRSDKGLVITTGTFTADAKREANRDGAPPIDLIDGDLLCDLLKQLKLGVKTELVERVAVETNWFSTV